MFQSLTHKPLTAVWELDRKEKNLQSVCVRNCYVFRGGPEKAGPINLYVGFECVT